MSALVPVEVKKHVPWRCDICGRFTAFKNLVLIGGEDNEEWFECLTCLSPSDFKTYFPHLKKQRLLK